MVKIELTPTQIEKAIRRMPIEEKIKIMRKLEKETWAKRLDNVVLRIKKRINRNPISQKEINRICEEARQKVYNERSKSRH